MQINVFVDTNHAGNKSRITLIQIFFFLPESCSHKWYSKAQ